METIEIKAVKVDSLSMPGDVRHRVSLERVKSLAHGLELVGQLHPVVIRKRDGRWISGRDRAAAALVAKLETLVVQYVECTDEEAAIAERSENLHRRHDPDEQARLVTELVPLLAKRVTADERKPEGWPNARPVSPKVVARRMLAAQRGCVESTIRRLEHRVAHREETRAAAKRSTGIDTLGVQPDPALLSSVAEVSVLLESAKVMIRRAKKHLEGIKTPIPRVSQQALVRQADDLLTQLKALEPTTVCPYCKGIEQLKPGCTGCDASGWLGKGQLQDVPKELLNPAFPQVVVDGKLMSAAELLGLDGEAEDTEDPDDLFT